MAETAVFLEATAVFVEETIALEEMAACAEGRAAGMEPAGLAKDGKAPRHPVAREVAFGTGQSGKDQEDCRALEAEVIDDTVDGNKGRENKQAVHNKAAVGIGL